MKYLQFLMSEKQNKYLKPSFGSLRLRFKNQQLEEQFLIDSAQLNVLPLMGSGIVLSLVSGSYILWYWPPVMKLDNGPRLMTFLSEVAVAFMGAVYFFTSWRFRNQTITARDARFCERSIVFYYLILIALAVTSERYRAASLHGIDAEEAFPEIDAFTDSDFLLMLDAYVTVCSLLFQIDPLVYAIVPVCACLAFVLSSAIIGSGENNEPVKGTLMLAGLGVLAILGRRLAEGDKRVLFVEKIAEKTQRFAAEHQHDRLVETHNKLREHHNKLVAIQEESTSLSSTPDAQTPPTSEGISAFHLSNRQTHLASSHATESHPVTSSGTILSEASNEELSFQFTESSVASRNESSDVTSRRPSEPSEVHASRETHMRAMSKHEVPAVDEVGVQTESLANSYEDKATDPLILWAETGWKCNRCSKPPRLPNSVENSSMAGSAPGSHTNQLSRQRSRTSSGLSRGGTGTSGPVDARHAGGTGEQVSRFCLTPFTTKQVMIEESLLRWNCSRGGESHCCPYHTAIKDARLAAKALMKEPCNPLWMPLTIGQCMHCFSLQDSAEPGDTCDICGSSQIQNSDSSMPPDEEEGSVMSQDLSGSTVNNEQPNEVRNDGDREPACVESNILSL